MVGRREEALLALPSIRRMVDVLGTRCRDISWVRTSVSSIDRFAALTGQPDLEGLLVRAKADASEAHAALAAFARALDGASQAQIAALELGPMLWFTFNGVALDWRASAAPADAPRHFGSALESERLVLLALIGSGLRRAELLRLRLGDIGSLDADGRLVHDVAAVPLAVRFVQVRGGREYVTFFSEQTRDALLKELDRRTAAGERLGADSPLVAPTRATGSRRASVARAARFNTALIEAGNNVNVELCVATGRFFRAWGLPGARFVETPAPTEVNS
ncbi:MAG: hypothetical protein NVS2B3_01640 [Vulcanimicrobiaceae bacterium]